MNFKEKKQINVTLLQDSNRSLFFRLRLTFKSLILFFRNFFFLSHYESEILKSIKKLEDSNESNDVSDEAVNENENVRVAIWRYEINHIQKSLNRNPVQFNKDSFNLNLENNRYFSP